MPGDYLWQMLWGYGFTIVVETAVLLVGLSACHSWRRRILAGIWLTACTYPIVWLVIPAVFPPEQSRSLYLLVAETFAPVAECALFWFTFDRGAARATVMRDFAAIVVANLASFGLGELMYLL